MSPARVARTVLALLAMALPSALAVRSGAAPVPYSELLKREGRDPVAPRRAKPKPKPHAARPAGATTASAGAPGAPPRPPSPNAAVPPPPAAPLARPVAPGAARAAAQALPGTAPADALRPSAAPAPPRPSAPPPPELPLAAAAPPPLTAAGARLPAGAAPPAAEVEAFVDGLVRQAGAERPLAGVAVAVVQGGQVVLERGYGEARAGAAVDPRATLFRLGSASKLLTWIEVLKAVEAGRLRLDDPVNTRLPRELAAPDDGFRTPVRLRNLMTHDAGFESREFGRLFRPDPAGRRPLARTLAAERPHRVRAPGDMPTYSTYGAALAGFLAADAARQPFDRWMDDDLLRPAGLAHTTFGEPGPTADGLPAPMAPALAAQLAQGYAWGRDGLRAEPFGYAGGWAPALSASTTADDMARLMLAYLAGGRAVGTGAPLWGARTEAALRTPLAPGWAHGWMVYDLPGAFRGFGHDGEAPGFRAKLVVVPQLNLGVFVAGNSDTAERLVDSLPELLVRRFYAGPPPAGPGADLPDAKAYAGTYVSTRRTYHGLEGLVDRLTRLYAVRAGAGGALVIRGPDGVGRRWLATAERGRLVAADGTGAPLSVLFDGAGRLRAFLDPAGQRGAERVDLLHRPGTLAVAAGGAALAAILTLGGLFVRDARESRQTRRQTDASRLQSVTAFLWLVALGLFATFSLTTGEGLAPRRWPDPWLVGASATALTAALFTLLQVAQLPGALASERRLQGWTVGRKLRHAATILVFLGFGFVLLGWGALEPWSS